MFAAAACLTSGVFAGATIGIIFGYAVTGHNDVLCGIEPKTSNPLVRLLARPTGNLTLVEGLLFLIVILSWLAVFFALLALPLYVNEWSGDVTGAVMLFAYGSLSIAWFIGQVVGKRLWIKSATK